MNKISLKNPVLNQQIKKQSKTFANSLQNSKIKHNNVDLRMEELYGIYKVGNKIIRPKFPR